MKNSLFYSTLAFLALSSNAFAIDQVILKSGAVVEGTILSDVPNRYVDIRLINGSTKRYQQTDVASVERDVPSDHDSAANGSTSEFYIGPQMGMELPLDTTYTGNPSSIFTWGGRAGVNVTQMGNFAKLALGLSFTHTTNTVFGQTSNYNQILAQILFRKISNSGFYFGGEFGMSYIVATSTLTLGDLRATPFVFGAVLGYDYYLSPTLSIGPDIRYENVGIQNYTINGAAYTSNPSKSQMQFLFTLTFHL